jgi:uncharacterized membrane protein
LKQQEEEKIRNRMMNFNETLLKLDQDDSKEIEEVNESIEKQKNGIKLEEFVAQNKWQVYKDLVDVFKERTKNDNELKKKYSKILIGILILQLIVMNLIFILKGLSILNFADTTFNLFITATIAEVFTLVTIIVRYLFTDNLTELLKKLLSDENKDGKKDKKD